MSYQKKYTWGLNSWEQPLSSYQGVGMHHVIPRYGVPIWVIVLLHRDISYSVPLRVVASTIKDDLKRHFEGEDIPKEVVASEKEFSELLNLSQLGVLPTPLLV